jgi:hypothetical protein
MVTALLHTTFNLLRKAEACKRRYKYLARTLGGIRKYGADKPISLLKICEVNGLDDAEWVLCQPYATIEADAKRERLAKKYDKQDYKIWYKKYHRRLFHATIGGPSNAIYDEFAAEMTTFFRKIIKGSK